MNVTEANVSSNPSDIPPSPGASLGVSQSRPVLAAAVGALELCALFGMIVWLALKDWFTSSTVPYPYSESLGISLSVVLCALAAFTISRSSFWRDILLGVVTLFCLVYLIYSFRSPVYWSIMPIAGILVCALGFPWPADPRWLNSRRQIALLPSLIRRRCYMLAAFVGLSSFVLAHDSNLPMASLTVAALIASGFLLRSLVRSSATFVPARIGLITVYAVCIVSYWAMSISSLYTASSWSWVGNGLDSGTGLDYHYCSDSLFEDGLASVIIRGLILTGILSANLFALLRWSRLQADTISDVLRREIREAMELSVGALLSVVTLVFLLPFFAPTPWPDPTSTGSWALGLSLASLCIGTRTLRTTQDGLAPRVIIRKRITAICAGVAIVGLIVLVCVIPVNILAQSLSQSPSNVDGLEVVPLRAIPRCLQKAAVAETSETSPLTASHDLLRQSYGAKLNVEPTLYTSLTSILVARDHTPAIVRGVESPLLSLLMSSYVGPQEALELYLNLRDYGAPTPGLRAASSYYFHKPLTQITASDGTFLVSDPEYCQNEPLTRFRNAPALSTQLSDPQDYTYVQVPLPLPASHINNIHHDGMVNMSDEAVGTASTSLGVRPYAWKDGKIRSLPGLDGGYDSSFAIADNDRGLVVGYSYGPNGQHAVLWDAHDRVTDLGTLPGYKFSVARSINSQGQVVGYAFSPSAGSGPLGGPARAFLWQSGKMIDLGTVSGCTSSRAYSINDRGQIAGWVLTNDDATHAMVYQNGVMHDIGTLGGKTSLATAINNQGQVVGAAQRYDGTVASFFWQNGTMHDIGRLADDDIRGRAWSINDLGQVVGLSYGFSYGHAVDLNSFGGHPYIWDIAHGIRPLAALMRGDPANTHNIFHSYTVFSINNKGEILGLNFLPGIRRMFLLKPAPNKQPTIIWDNPVQVTSVKQIDTKGVLVHAGHWGGSRSTLTVAVGGKSIGFAARTVNGSGISEDLATASGLSIYTGAYLSSTGDPSFDSVLNSFAYGGPNPRIINLRGLIPGHNYEVQLFTADDRDLVPQDHRPGTRAVCYGDRPDFTGNNSNQFLMRDNASVIGRFTAIGPQVQIYQDQLNPVDHGGNINAYMLRDVTNLNSLVPQPIN